MCSQRKSGLMRRLKGQMLRRMHGMITCGEFEEFVQAYLDDELTQRQSTLFNWHLRLCRECREYLAAYRRSMEISHAVFTNPEDSLPDNVPEELIAAILASKE